MIRRSYRRFGRGSNTNAKTKTLNFASPEECRIFAYYLYTICKYKIEFYPDREEDSAVDRNISSEVSNPTLAEIDLYRVFHVTHSNNIFLAVIANFLIRKTPEKEAGLLTKIPSHLKKSLKDFSKFDFAKKALNLSETKLALLLNGKTRMRETVTQNRLDFLAYIFTLDLPCFLMRLQNNSIFL